MRTVQYPPHTKKHTQKKKELTIAKRDNKRIKKRKSRTAKKVPFLVKELAPEKLARLNQKQRKNREYSKRSNINKELKRILEMHDEIGKMKFGLWMYNNIPSLQSQILDSVRADHNRKVREKRRDPQYVLQTEAGRLVTLLSNRRSQISTRSSTTKTTKIINTEEKTLKIKYKPIEINGFIVLVTPGPKQRLTARQLFFERNSALKYTKIDENNPDYGVWRPISQLYPFVINSYLNDEIYRFIHAWQLWDSEHTNDELTVNHVLLILLDAFGIKAGGKFMMTAIYAFFDGFLWGSK